MKRCSKCHEPKEKEVVINNICQFCGAEFERVRKSKRYCCRLCATAAWKRDHSEENRMISMKSSKEWYKHNSDKAKASAAQWRNKNPERNKELMKNATRAYRARDPQHAKIVSAAYVEKNRAKINKANRERKRANKEYRRNYVRDRKRKDPAFAVAVTLRSRLVGALKTQGAHKTAKSIELLGCTIQECRQYLESLWVEGMSWENHGMGNDKWQIDHIKPCDAFDLTDPEQQRQCFNYQNLQPLWQRDNLSKSSKYAG